MYVTRGFERPVGIWKVDLESGEREMWRRVEPLNGAGVILLGNILIVAEADAYVTSYLRVLSELYLLEDLTVLRSNQLSRSGRQLVRLVRHGALRSHQRTEVTIHGDVLFGVTEINTAALNNVDL